jgi:hypothetical protein
VWNAGGWILPLILLALPACVLDTTGYGYGDETFQQGAEPLTGGVQCVIPQTVEPEGGWPCATPDDLATGIPSTSAAVLLNSGGGGSVLLDYSKDSDTKCGNGNPRVIPVRGGYPTGFTACLNCGQLPGVYTDGNAVCQAQCKSLFNHEGDGGSGDNVCAAYAKTAPNWTYSCQNGICSNSGTPNSNWPDPRINPESLVWKDLQGVVTQDNDSTIYFDGTIALPPDGQGFSAGAASAQLITEGDAFVEFEAGEANASHVVSLRTTCDNPATCPDNDGTLGDLDVFLNLHYDNTPYVLDKALNTLFHDVAVTYTPGQRFRINVTDMHNGKAKLSFSRFVAGSWSVFYDDAGVHAVSYPLRVDASFREAGAHITKAAIMRIIQK